MGLAVAGGGDGGGSAGGQHHGGVAVQARVPERACSLCVCVCVRVCVYVCVCACGLLQVCGWAAMRKQARRTRLAQLSSAAGKRQERERGAHTQLSLLAPPSWPLGRPQALLNNGDLIRLIPQDHAGFAEVKWCANRFVPFVSINPQVGGRGRALLQGPSSSAKALDLVLSHLLWKSLIKRPG